MLNRKRLAMNHRVQRALQSINVSGNITRDISCVEAIAALCQAGKGSVYNMQPRFTFVHAANSLRGH